MHGGCADEHGGEGEDAAGEGEGGGSCGNQEWAAGVAEFAADLGGAHDGAEALWRAVGGQRCEGQWGGQADSGAGDQGTGQ